MLVSPEENFNKNYSSLSWVAHIKWSVTRVKIMLWLSQLIQHKIVSTVRQCETYLITISPQGWGRSIYCWIDMCPHSHWETSTWCGSPLSRTHHLGIGEHWVLMEAVALLSEKHLLSPRNLSHTLSLLLKCSVCPLWVWQLVLRGHPTASLLSSP